MEAENSKIYSAIAGVIADIGHVGKDNVNVQQHYKFRSIDDVYNALHPALAKNKLFIVPDILEREVNTVVTKNNTKMFHVICRIRFTFYAEDGSHVSSTIVGEAMDTADKATNKAMAIAYKYACFQVFCIPTEEMLDPDAVTPEEQAANPKKTQAKPAAARPQSSAPAQQPQPEPQPEPKVDANMIATMRSELERIGRDETLLTNLFKVETLADMTVQQFKKAMKKFEISPSKGEQNNE